jgi:hypothetical protein
MVFQLVMPGDSGYCTGSTKRRPGIATSGIDGSGSRFYLWSLLEWWFLVFGGFEMSNDNPLKAPWTAKPAALDYADIYDGDGELLVRVLRPTNHAAVRAILAVPEVLAELKRIRGTLADDNSGNVLWVSCGETAWEAADNAIAKAEGTDR